MSDSIVPLSRPPWEWEQLDLQAIVDNNISEDLHTEYRASRLLAKTPESTKDAYIRQDVSTIDSNPANQSYTTRVAHSVLSTSRGFAKKGVLVAGAFTMLGLGLIGCAVTSSTPAIDYALDLGLSHLAQQLAILDQDGILDGNEREFIDGLHYINSLIPQDVRHYYTDEDIISLQEKLARSVLSDGQVSSNEVVALGYLRGFNRWEIQRDVVNSEMIDDGYLGENWDGDKSETGKHLTNIIELEQGTNPLNDLETDPSDLSERYAVIAALSNVFLDSQDPSILVPTDLIAHDALEFYHLLRMNGYDDDHISLFLYHIDQKMEDIGPGVPIPKPIPNSVSGWIENEDNPNDDIDGIDDYILPDDDWQWEGDNEWAGKNLLSDLGPVQIDYENERVTVENFLNEVSNLPTDENDVIFIYYASHGVGTSTPGEGAIAFTAGPEELDSSWHGFILYDIFMRHYLLNKAIQNIGNYSRLIIMQDGCNTGAVLKDLDKTDEDQDYRNGVEPSPIRNTLALSPTSPDESQSGVGFGHYFLNLLRQDPYQPISEVFQEANRVENASSDATVENSVMYHFDIDMEPDTKHPWADLVNIVGYFRLAE